MHGKSSDALTLIRRLQSIDASLASSAGLHILTAALQHGVSAKTIQRDLALIRDLGHPHRQKRLSGDGPGNHGDEHRHWYTDRRRRLFARITQTQDAQ
jgi:predicted DNA-binding transcriptional regulator YafY